MDTVRADPFRHDVKVIGLVGLAHGMSHFFQLALPSMFPLLRAEFDVSFAALGALAGVFYLGSGLTQFASTASAAARCFSRDSASSPAAPSSRALPPASDGFTQSLR